MGFLDNLKNSLSTVSGQLTDQVSRFRSADFAEATMSICALIAAADGSISPDERRKVAGFITSNDSLKVFQAADLKARFDKYCDKLTQDYDFGRIEAIQAIGKLRSKPDQARAVIQLGLIIGAADGTFDEAERVQVRDAARAVNLDPVEFGV
ncbi:tellurite resistance TerB family protein [Deinococcus sonorensis]|uniref:Tellurite resistance TerB family protein n=2 Tax=Deinococcus sonorensis TaxID=309891 RepID=A0AAU7UBD8_9DEIO